MFYSTKSSWFLTGIDGCLCWYDRPRGYFFVALVRMIKATRGCVYITASPCMNVLIVAFMCVWINLFACVNNHLLVCVTIHNIVYCTVYFALKGRELKGRVWRIVSPPQVLKFGSWGFRRGQHFYIFFPYNRGFQERNPRVKGGQLYKLYSDLTRTWHPFDLRL